MGRIKLKIKRLESTSNRQVTYSKRRNGILKKAKELSILCDIDIVLLMFSPTGRPALFEGENSNFEEVITKFANLTPYERAKRKRETLEALTKAFKKVDQDVNIQSSCSSDQTSEMRFDDEQLHYWQDLKGQQISLQEQMTGLQRSLSFYSNPNKINDLNYLTQMEDRLRESMNRLRIHKESFGENSLMSLMCSNQFQNEMPFPLIVDGGQEARSMSWFLNDENQQFFTVEPDFLPHGDVQYAAEASLPGCSGYFGNNELSISSGPRADFPCLETGFSEDVSLKPSFETLSIDYQVSSDFVLPASLYENLGPSGAAHYHLHQQMK